MKEIMEFPQHIGLNSSIPSSSASQIQSPGSSSRNRNVILLLARREISPRTRHIRKNRWGETSKVDASNFYWPRIEAVRDARQEIFSWVETESLHNLSAKYCPLAPPPRSTIAAAFSSDGRTLASTHGDHTVKIIDCQTGSCLKVLSGHRRTPWVVRFHPLYSEILASGSLDHEVRLWDAKTSDCIGAQDFYRPIASIAFHAKGELLAVASGHKLYIWHYSRRGDGSSPTMVLRTKRSLRAVHFHPHGAPYMMTAEVNDLDSSDSSITRATSPGYLRYPPPAVFLTNVRACDHAKFTGAPLTSLQLTFRPPYTRYTRSDSTSDGSHTEFGSMQFESSALPFQMRSDMGEVRAGTVCPMETSLLTPPRTYHGASNNNFLDGIQSVNNDSATSFDAMETTEVQSSGGSSQASANLDVFGGNPAMLIGSIGQVSSQLSSDGYGSQSHFLSCRDPSCWELPFLQGWLLGQSQVGIPATFPFNDSSPQHSSRYFLPSSISRLSNGVDPNAEASTSTEVPNGFGFSGISGRPNTLDDHTRSQGVFIPDLNNPSAPTSGHHDGGDTQPIISRIQTELSTSLASVAAAELPCTVMLRVWSHDSRSPCSLLNSEKCRLTIPHAVLCSEMGAHFSPCGRYLAACVACTISHVEGDSGLQAQNLLDNTGLSTSPTRHPISAHRVIYELRIYSLEEATFGSVLVSRTIRAAHCLTSIQFSPMSEHILLAYGRRHSSLLKSIVIDGETTTPIYTILEIYRVSDMELVRVLPSAEDEVNVASFHPLAGGGLVYGTKEGKLRLLQYDGNSSVISGEPNFSLNENILELQAFALEC